MPDIKLDLAEILNNENLNTLIFAGCGGLVSYEIFSCSTVNSIIIGFATFLITKGIVKILKYATLYYRNWRERKSYQKDKEDRINHIVQRMIVLFKSLGKDAIKGASCLYNMPKGENEKFNERYIPLEAWQKYFNILYYELNIDNNYKILYSDNKENVREGGQIHIMFDPIFCKILENYIKSEVVALPKDFKSKTLMSYYR